MSGLSATMFKLTSTGVPTGLEYLEDDNKTVFLISFFNNSIGFVNSNFKASKLLTIGCLESE